MACFKGVKRPLDGEDDGNSILTYVLNVPVSVEYNPDLVCVASSFLVPPGTCATVQVKPTSPRDRLARSWPPALVRPQDSSKRVGIVASGGLGRTGCRGRAEVSPSAHRAHQFILNVGLRRG